MKIVQYLGDHTFVTSTQEVRSPGPREVQIQVAYVGLCGTDLHVYQGEMDKRVGRPATIGHEMSGVVARLGCEVSGLAVGDKVTVLPTMFCGECPACRRGHSNVCYKMVFVGLDTEGALQQFWNVPERLVMRLDASIDLRKAALIEPLAVAVHDVRRAEIGRGQTVLVVGGGPIGILIALTAQACGAEVLLSEPEEWRRQIAEKMGIRVVDPTEGRLGEALELLSPGEGRAQTVFEVSGSQMGVDSAVEFAAAHGRIVLVAIHAMRREMDLHAFFWREIELMGARLYRREDMEEASRMIQDAVIDVEPLITKECGPEAVSSAFEKLAGASAMKILISMN